MSGFQVVTLILFAIFVGFFIVAFVSVATTLGDIANTLDIIADHQKDRP